MIFSENNLTPSKHQWLDWIPAALLTVGIAIVSLVENPNMPVILSAKDKIIHGGMYAILAITWMLPVSRRFPLRVMPYVYVWMGVTFYGALMEVLQRFCTLTRSGEMADLYADAIGAIIGVIVVSIGQCTMPKEDKSDNGKPIV